MLPGSWDSLIEVVEAVAAASGPAEDFPLPAVVAGVEVRPGLVLLEIAADADREGLARAVGALGPPVGLDVVSPPAAGAGGRPPWDSKHSVGHDLAGRRVWFGIESTAGVDRLVSVTVRFEGPPAEHLPPEGRDGPFRLTTSLGWCGGFGEAVLDEAGGIRRHDGRAVYVDGAGQDRILERVDLSGTWRGGPVIRIAGRGRLERRTGRNASIPGAPRARWVALVIESLDEARVEGERATGEEM